LCSVSENITDIEQHKLLLKTAVAQHPISILGTLLIINHTHIDVVEIMSLFKPLYETVFQALRQSVPAQPAEYLQIQIYSLSIALLD
jgi:hypothetical protein